MRFEAISALLVVGATVLAATSQQTVGVAPESAQLLLDAGVNAFKDARYGEAVTDFRKAVELEPENNRARLHLGTAYAYQVVPNLDTPENLKTASAALHEFDVVLKDDPHNLEALREEAAIYRNIKQLEKAKAMEHEVIAADPTDAEAYYTLGVVDWMQAYQNSRLVLAKEDLTDDGIGNAKLSNAGCDALEQTNGALVEDAIASLGQAVRLRPSYDDAMQYLNLIYRRSAELHCHDRSSAAGDIALAEEWSAKAMKARKENEPRKENDAIRPPR